MACSSVSVVASSLALKWWKRPRWMREEEVLGDAKVMDALMEGARTGGKRKDGVLGRVKGVVGGLKRGKKEGDRGSYVPLMEIGEV